MNTLTEHWLAEYAMSELSGFWYEDGEAEGKIQTFEMKQFLYPDLILLSSLKIYFTYSLNSRNNLQHL